MTRIDPATWPAIVLFSVALALALVRTRPSVVKLGTETIAVAAIAYTLWDRGFSPLPAAHALTARPDGAWLRALAVVWWLVGARLVVTIVEVVRGRDGRSQQARLLTDLMTGLIYVSAAYVIADSILDLPVRTLIATSGVIAVVLGLALQSTLSDLFSGIAVGIEQPFGIGDDVALDSGLEGEITEMNWRSVRLRTDLGDIAMIPNSVIAKATVTNHSRPSRHRKASVLVPVRAAASASRVIELLRQSLMLCPDVLADPEPVVSVKSLGRFGADFSIAFYVADSDRLTAATAQVLRQARRFLRQGGMTPGPVLDLATCLRDLALFEGLGDAQLASVEAALVKARFDAGETMLVLGEQVEALTIVTAGVAEVTHEAAGLVERLGRIGPGEYLGEIAMMLGEPIPVTVSALTAVEVLQLPKTALMALVAADPGFANALQRSVSRGLAQIERDAAARAIHSTPNDKNLFQRLAHFLNPAGISGRGSGQARDIGPASR